MTHRRAPLAALLLLTFAFCASLPGHALPGNPPHRPAGTSSLHQRIVNRLATPDVAVALAGIGILLIFLECNLPGAVLPGATGLLLLLSGIYGLSLQPLRPSAIAVLLLAGLALALSPKLPLRGITAALGTTALIFGLTTLVRETPPGSGVHPLVAILIGAAVGLSATLLGRVARRARRNKAILSPGAKV